MELPQDINKGIFTHGRTTPRRCAFWSSFYWNNCTHMIHYVLYERLCMCICHVEIFLMQFFLYVADCKYFGGREISSEDLEGALLVGLSPHARIKVEKRRGIYFKHSEWSAIPKIFKSTCPDTTESGTNVIVKLNESSRYNLENVLSEAALSSTEQQYHTRKGLERESAFTSTVLNGNVDQSDGTCGSSLFLPKQVSSKHKKLSVFGEGPHGKQVVEHLLHTHGEDGIKQFCQRWRQVFVEAVHPQFLPSDWDVMSR